VSARLDHSELARTEREQRTVRGAAVVGQAMSSTPALAPNVVSVASGRAAR